MLHVIAFISPDAFRVSVRGKGGGHLVIACSEFAFIAARDQGACRPSTKTEEFHAIKLNYVFPKHWVELDLQA
jgi:hypothetical protein